MKDSKSAASLFGGVAPTLVCATVPSTNSLRVGAVLISWVCAAPG